MLAWMWTAGSVCWTLSGIAWLGEGGIGVAIGVLHLGLAAVTGMAAYAAIKETS